MITKAFKIVNTPLKDLLIHRNDIDIDWAYYGFNPSTLSRLAVQCYDANGDYIQILPISNNELAQSRLMGLQNIIANNDFDNDSIEIISWEAAQVIIAELTAIRDAGLTK